MVPCTHRNFFFLMCLASFPFSHSLPPFPHLTHHPKCSLHIYLFSIVLNIGFTLPFIVQDVIFALSLWCQILYLNYLILFKILSLHNILLYYISSLHYLYGVKCHLLWNYDNKCHLYIILYYSKFCLQLSFIALDVIFTLSLLVLNVIFVLSLWC